MSVWIDDGDDAACEYCGLPWDEHSECDICHADLCPNEQRLGDCIYPTLCPECNGEDVEEMEEAE